MVDPEHPSRGVQPNLPGLLIPLETQVPCGDGLAADGQRFLANFGHPEVELATLSRNDDRNRAPPGREPSRQKVVLVGNPRIEHQRSRRGPRFALLLSPLGKDSRKVAPIAEFDVNLLLLLPNGALPSSETAVAGSSERRP
jgi:hypothetical protein